MLEASTSTKSLNVDDNMDCVSDSQNLNTNNPRRFGSDSESNPPVGTDVRSIVDIEGSTPDQIELEQEDGLKVKDVETFIAGDVLLGGESNGDPGDDFNDDNNSVETFLDESAESLASPSYLKIVIGVIFLMIVLFVVIDSVFGMNYVYRVITIFLEWIRQNPGEGLVAFIGVYFIATLICVPGALLTFGAGFVFSAASDGSLVVGVVLGALAVFVGSFASSIVAFLLARYLLYDRVRTLSQKYTIFEALDIALSEKGFRIMCLLRLSPITPFVLLNYIAGVTTVKLSSYVLSTFCILPGTVLYVFLGASAGSLTDESENSTVTITSVIVGVIFGVLAICLTSHYAKNELNKEVDLVRSRLYNRTTSRRNRQRYRRNSQRRQRSRYRRRIDRKRAGRPF